MFGLPVVEVQQTFYQPPLPRTLGKWRREAPQDFEFTSQARQLMTHESVSPTYRRLREKLSEQQKREELGLVRGVDPFQQAQTAGRLRYFRLHGRTGCRYHYTERDLARLAGTVRGGPACYVLFNNVSMFEGVKRFPRLAAKV